MALTVEDEMIPFGEAFMLCPTCGALTDYDDWKFLKRDTDGTLVRFFTWAEDEPVEMTDEELLLGCPKCDHLHPGLNSVLVFHR